MVKKDEEKFKNITIKITLIYQCDFLVRLKMSVKTSHTPIATLSELNRALINAKNADETKLLLEAAGAEALAYVNAKDIYGDTALMHLKCTESKKLIEDAIDKVKTLSYSPETVSLASLKHIVWLPIGTEYEIKFF